MRRSCGSRWIAGGLLALGWMRLGAQTGAGGAYRMRVAVDEVVLTLHASDAQGLPVNDVKADELRIRDEGRAPRAVLSFTVLRGLPLRVGLVMDTSESMRTHVGRDRAIATKAMAMLLRKPEDAGFVMEFGRLSTMVQPWTGDAGAMAAGVRAVRFGGQGTLKGTAIFDTVYRACLNQFGRGGEGVGGNVMLLFSDGEDNGSSISLGEAAAECERSNTAVYAFRSVGEEGSTGPATLEELAAKTGGQVFRDDDADAVVSGELRGIEEALRNQYRLVYRPAVMAHDGRFHRIEITGPDRVDRITVRSGYYAPRP